jgi:hypothetical protein
MNTPPESPSGYVLDIVTPLDTCDGPVLPASSAPIGTHAAGFVCLVRLTIATALDARFSTGGGFRRFGQYHLPRRRHRVA